jgi:hypothetical protein
LLRKLQKSVYEINAFFSISLLVASIVRWRQVPSVMETVFISYVVWVQVLIISSMLFAQLSDYSMNRSNLSWDWNVYYLAIGIAQLVTSCVVEVPHRSVYKELATECHRQHQFINVSAYLPASEKGTMTLKWYIIGAVGGLALGILSGALSKVLHRIIPEWLRKHGETIFLVSVLLLNVVSVIANTIVTEYVRGLLKKMTGDQLPDNGWSYGQTTAILLWFPFFWTASKETISWYPILIFSSAYADGRTENLRDRHSDERTAEEMAILGQESALPTGVEAIPPPYTPRKDAPIDADLLSDTAGSHNRAK